SNRSHFSSPDKMSSESKEMKAVELISPRKFHRIFTVPAAVKHGPLKVSYSIAGLDLGEGVDVPNILWCGAMFGTRWQAPWIDYAADKANVRIICIDRPGFGASTPVPLQDRLDTFLEIIPLLLAHLGIKYVALSSHSAGTIYAFNLLTQHPELLYPSNPSITFFSPWVHQSHSSVSLLKVASMLPNALLGQWNKVMGFVLHNVQPVLSVSGGASQIVSQPFKNKLKTEKQKEEDERKCMRGYGVSLEIKAELDKAAFRYGFAENSEGLNDEARLCLRSVKGISWGACEDYEECIKALKEAWGKRVEGGGKPLSVSVFLPEEDMMVEDKGMKYFEDVWREENRGNGLKVEVVRWKGTDHDSAPNPSNDAVWKMFELVKGVRTVGSDMEVEAS
ncbi:hypothetical protein D0Z07_5873, partial [Hyphodiscus hymeniophilus]